MDTSVEPLCFGTNLEKIKSLDQKYFREAERQVQVVRENLQLAQSRQKSYVDHRRRKLSFKVGDFVYLKEWPMRGLHHFKIRGKFAPRYIGSFKILEQRGEIVYQLELPPQLSDVHDIFMFHN
jgi:hypothetical protein